MATLATSLVNTTHCDTKLQSNDSGCGHWVRATQNVCLPFQQSSQRVPKAIHLFPLGIEAVSLLILFCQINATVLTRMSYEVIYTRFRFYGLRIYGLFGFILVIWSMVNQILVLNFSDIWSFRLYGRLYRDKTVDHISETRCNCFKELSPPQVLLMGFPLVVFPGTRCSV